LKLNPPAAGAAVAYVAVVLGPNVTMTACLRVWGSVGWRRRIGLWDGPDKLN